MQGAGVMIHFSATAGHQVALKLRVHCGGSQVWVHGRFLCIPRFEVAWSLSHHPIKITWWAKKKNTDQPPQKQLHFIMQQNTRLFAAQHFCMVCTQDLKLETGRCGYLLTRVLDVPARRLQCSPGSCCCPGGGLWPVEGWAGSWSRRQNGDGRHQLVMEG